MAFQNTSKLVCPCCFPVRTVATDSYLLFRCWILPRHLKRPFTIMAMRVHKASHSSMLSRDEEENVCFTQTLDPVLAFYLTFDSQSQPIRFN